MLTIFRPQVPSFCTTVDVFGNIFAPRHARTRYIFFFQHLFHSLHPPTALPLPDPTRRPPQPRQRRARDYGVVAPCSKGVCLRPLQACALRARAGVPLSRALRRRHQPTLPTRRFFRRTPPQRCACSRAFRRPPASPCTFIDCEWSECWAARATMRTKARAASLSSPDAGGPTLSNPHTAPSGCPFAAQIGSAPQQRWWLAMACSRCVASDTPRCDSAARALLSSRAALAMARLPACRPPLSLQPTLTPLLLRSTLLAKLLAQSAAL